MSFAANRVTRKNSADIKLKEKIHHQTEPIKQMRRRRIKKKNKKLGESATDNTEPVANESEEEFEEEQSEENSPKKPACNSRAARVGIIKPIYKDLNEELSNLQEEKNKEWGEGLFKALRAKSVRKEENPVMKGKMNGGTSTTAEAIMDSR